MKKFISWSSIIFIIFFLMIVGFKIYTMYENNQRDINIMEHYLYESIDKKTQEEREKDYNNLFNRLVKMQWKIDNLDGTSAAAGKHFVAGKTGYKLLKSDLDSYYKALRKYEDKWGPFVPINKFPDGKLNINKSMYVVERFIPEHH